MNQLSNECKAQSVLYLERPSSFIPKLEVVACYIQCEDKILFLKRHLLKSEGNTWCVPGGKKDAHESLTQAILRETEEETGLILPHASLNYICETYVRYPKIDFIYHLFQATVENFPEIQLSAEEHQEYCWTTLLESKKLILTPGVEEALNILFQ